jgi:hypothetical protein
MKKQLLFALWACLALIKANSQELKDDKSIATKSFKDTLMIIPSSDMKVMLLGKFQKDLSNFNDIDSLKQMLINDVIAARKQEDYPTGSKLTHYFVTAEGKRRLKAENEDYQETTVNVQREKRALRLDLHSYEYIIYALKNNYECHIYLKDPGNLDKLSRINFAEAINAAKADPWNLKNSSRLDVEQENEKWILKNHSRTKQDMIELSPSFGLTLIGNKMSPTASLNLSIILSNKYGHGTVKTGVSYDLSTFADWSNNSISNLNLVHSYQLYIMSNLSDSKQRWVGLQGGILKSKENESPFNNKWKFGFVTEGFGSFNYTFDVIMLGNKKAIYSLGLKLPF